MNRKNDDLQKLQETAHYYGCDEFLEMICRVLRNASDDMETINEELSDQYNMRWTQLRDILDENK